MSRFEIDPDLRMVVVNGRRYPSAKISSVYKERSDWPYTGFRLPIENGWFVGALWRRWPRADGVKEPCGETANVWHERDTGIVGDLNQFVYADGSRPPEPRFKNWMNPEEFHAFVEHVASWPSCVPSKVLTPPR